MSTATPTRRRWIHRLPFDAEGLLTPPVRRFFLGTLCGALGTGLVLPFFVIYCTEIRHFPTIAAAAILAWEALLGVALAPTFGTLVDRHGPSRILAVSMPLAAGAEAAIGFASTIPLMVVVATVFAVVGSGMWSAFSTLVTRIVPEHQRGDAFGINFMLLNLGIGIGVVAGGFIANLHDLRSFQAIYVLGGLLSLLSAIVWMTLRRHGGPLPAEAHHGVEHEGWREVLRDRRLRRYILFCIPMMVCGYGSIEAGLPLFIVAFASPHTGIVHDHHQAVRAVLHLSTRVVSLLFIFNTVTIVIGQILVLGAIRGKSRSRILGLVGVCWGVSWLFATASLYLGVVAAVIGLCLGQILFATGETLFQPVSGPLVNDLAPEHLRGRYNSLAGIVWGVSGAIGQLIAGAFLEVHDALAWTLFVAVGATLGGLGLTTMRRVLTPAQDGLAPSTA